MTEKFNSNISSRLAKSYQLLANFERQLNGQIDDPVVRANLVRGKQKIEERITELEIAAVTPAQNKQPTPQIPPSQPEALLPYLDDPDPTIRAWAVGELATTHLPSGFPYFVRAMKDADPEVRSKAATGLSCYGTYAIRPLLTAYKDRETQVRNSVISGLAHIGPAIVPYIIPILKDDVLEMHVLVVATLREVGPVIVPQLYQMLKWPYPNLVYSVVSVMGDIGNSETLTLLHSFATGQFKPTTWGGSISEAAQNAITKIRQRHGSQ